MSYVPSILDRAHDLRRDVTRLEALLADSRRKTVPLWRDLQPVSSDGNPIVIDAEPDGKPWVFLGLRGEEPWFAVDLPPSGDAPPAIKGATWQDLRALWPILSVESMDVLAYARGIVGWNRRQKFCSLCGAPTEGKDAGHQRVCTNPDCKSSHFPRTDPAVIMLVTDDQDRALLARQAIWPKGMVSALAGFVEPGETLEQAVAREVAEEVSIRVRSVSYVASQPWPFPSSLMMAFEAKADTTDITVDHDELEQAQWFTRDEVRQFSELPMGGAGVESGWAYPRRGAISRRLIRDWLARG